MAVGGDDRLAGREAMLGQQFGDGAVGGALLPQFQDDVSCRGQLLEPRWTPRCKPRDCGADRAGIKRGHGANIGEANQLTDSGNYRDMRGHSRRDNVRTLPALSGAASRTLRYYSADTDSARSGSSPQPIPGLIEDTSAAVDSPRPRTIRGQTHGLNAARSRTRSRTDRVQVPGNSASTSRLFRDPIADSKPYGIVGVGRALCSKDRFPGSCQSLPVPSSPAIRCRGSSATTRSQRGQPVRLCRLFRSDRNCMRASETQSIRCFLSQSLARRFNDGAR